MKRKREKRNKSVKKNTEKLNSTENELPVKKGNSSNNAASLTENIKEIKPESEQNQEGSKNHKTSVFSRIWTLLIALLLTVVLIETGLFTEAETKTLRWLAKFTSPPAAQNNVVIVNIDDDDYESLFEKKSPLNSQQLQNIIEVIARGNPKVIGVDIDTSDRSFTLFKSNPQWSPIVWSQAVDFDAEGEMVCCINPLGGQTLPAKDKTAPPILPKDSELVTRYKLFFEQEEKSKPTFVYEVLALYNPSKYEALKETDDSFFIKYAGDAEGTHRTNIKASELLSMSGDAALLKSKLDGKIVLFGGTFAEAKDYNETPLGLMQGINILASTIETEITNTGLKSPNKWYRFLISLFEAVFIILIFKQFTAKTAMLICLSSILPLTIILSLLLYGSLSGFVYFLPTLCLVIAYNILDIIKDYQKEKVAESFAISKESLKDWLDKKN